MTSLRRFWNYLVQFFKSGTNNPAPTSSADWNTTLRQGSVLPADIVKRLHIRSGDGDTQRIIVIASHSCDLVSPPSDEPYVEVLLARPIHSLQSGCTHAQSISKLHIIFQKDRADFLVEFLAVEKIRINKVDLQNVEADSSFELSSENLEILQRWLAARYFRATFPDGLIARLKPMKKKLANAAKTSPSAIIGIWIKYAPDDNDLPLTEPYEIWISIVYSTRVPDARTIANEAADGLRRAFEALYMQHEVWNQIDLVDCSIYSEAEFTVLDLLSSSQWKLDYISMRQSPLGEAL